MCVLNCFYKYSVKIGIGGNYFNFFIQMSNHKLEHRDK